MNKLLIALLFVPVIALADHTVPPKGHTAQDNWKLLCKDGHTGTVRPSTNYTNGLKNKWVVNGQNPKDYELDHFIPLELGGCPDCEDNLWLQKWSDARIKDKWETKLHRQMCVTAITLQDARKQLLNWKDAK